MKDTFGPKDLDRLSQRPEVCRSLLRCALCDFSSKVRRNLAKHLNLHTLKEKMLNEGEIKVVIIMNWIIKISYISSLFIRNVMPLNLIPLFQTIIYILPFPFDWYFSPFDTAASHGTSRLSFFTFCCRRWTCQSCARSTRPLWKQTAVIRYSLKNTMCKLGMPIHTTYRDLPAITYLIKTLSL